jgi:hypothetical protein
MTTPAAINFSTTSEGSGILEHVRLFAHSGHRRITFVVDLLQQEVTGSAQAILQILAKHRPAETRQPGVRVIEEYVPLAL